VAAQLNTIYGIGTSSYAEVREMDYEEFAAWCAFLAHHEFHRDDAALQAKHDQMMLELAAAARG
jgi:hypothetical protein